MKYIGIAFLIFWLLGLVGVIDFRICIGFKGSSCSRPPHTWSAK